MTSESNSSLRISQTLAARVGTEAPDEFHGPADVLSSLPESTETPREFRLIDPFLAGEFFPHTFAHEIGNGSALLPAQRGKDPREVFVKIQLGSFHGDV
jgi:hypothetical protein